MPDTIRAARYTTDARTEVELLHPFSANDGHADNGKPMRAYYETEHYRARQTEHGVAIYPEPQPAK